MRPPNLNAEFCPGCNRMRDTNNGNFVRHADASLLRECAFSQKPIPASRSHELACTARTVLTLATQLRDDDPGIVWRYLQAQPPTRIRELAMIALAAINPDQNTEQAYGWVMELPAASEAIA